MVKCGVRRLLRVSEMHNPPQSAQSGGASALNYHFLLVNYVKLSGLFGCKIFTLLWLCSTSETSPRCQHALMATQQAMNDSGHRNRFREGVINSPLNHCLLVGMYTDYGCFQKKQNGDMFLIVRRRIEDCKSHTILLKKQIHTHKEK